MRALLLSIVLAVFAAAPALASDQSEVLATARQFIDAIGKNDMQTAGATFAPQVSIIDEFPPYHWMGADAMADWGRDFGVFAQKNNVTDPVVTIGEPTQISVAGDHAYVVFHSSYIYKEAGKPVNETNSLMTFTFVKLAAGWRIAGWAWTMR